MTSNLRAKCKFPRRRYPPCVRIQPPDERAIGPAGADRSCVRSLAVSKNCTTAPARWHADSSRCWRKSSSPAANPFAAFAVGGSLVIFEREAPRKLPEARVDPRDGLRRKRRTPREECHMPRMMDTRWSLRIHRPRMEGSELSPAIRSVAPANVCLSANQRKVPRCSTSCACTAPR